MARNDYVIDPDGSRLPVTEIESCHQRLVELCKAKRFQEGLALGDQQITKNPLNFRGYANKAFVLGWMGNHAEQIKYKNKAVELAPQNPGLYFSRALLHYNMGNYAAAIPDFTRCAELDKEDQVVGPGNYLHLADCHRRLGNYAAAIADCSLVPDNFDFPGFLGHFEGTKRHLLAEIERERGIALEP
ncbi:MAG: tetratricopeptide repeat protein [Stellaceae bacterium]